MTADRMPPPPPVDRGGISWFKIVAFVMVLFVLATVASVIFGSGLGHPDDARRTLHPMGFSVSYPVGWGGTVYAAEARGADEIRCAPERSTGRQTILNVTRLRRAPKLPPTAAQTTFQDQPASVATYKQGRDWVWQCFFQRGAGTGINATWYRITIQSPLQLDWDKDPLMEYARSFRLETPTKPVPANEPEEPADASTSAPATAAATRPADAS